MSDDLSTKERLARVLEEEGLHHLSRWARRGVFDDFESEFATPKVLLSDCLRKAGREDLAQRAAAGEWDGTRAEADEWAREQGGELGAMLDRLGLR